MTATITATDASPRHKLKTRLAVVIVAALAVTGIGLAGAAPAHAATQVDNPQGVYDVPQYSNYTFEAKEFLANTAFTVRVDDATNGLIVGNFITDGNGDVGVLAPARVKISAAPGSHTLYFSDGTTTLPLGITVTAASTAELYIVEDESDFSPGGYLALYGTGWTHLTETTHGSTIALKIEINPTTHFTWIDDISVIPPYPANLTVWALIDGPTLVDDEGNFGSEVSPEIVFLPDGTDVTPTFGSGTYTIRALTGNIPVFQGDVQRSVESDPFTIP